jgi:hypothetical protein
MSCSLRPTCPLARLFTGKTSLRVWSERYCEGRFQACARYTAGLHGEPVPGWLLPNGRSLEAPPPEALLRRSA